MAALPARRQSAPKPRRPVLPPEWPPALSALPRPRPDQRSRTLTIRHRIERTSANADANGPDLRARHRGTSKETVAISVQQTFRVVQVDGDVGSASWTTLTPMSNLIPDFADDRIDLLAGPCF